jgi:hypothetical protein
MTTESTQVIVFATSWFGESVLFVGQVIALAVVAVILGVAAFVFLLLVMRMVNQMMRQALEAARETVYEQRGTGVPALFTLIGSTSAPLAGLLLAPVVSAFLAVAVAVVTFISATLAEDSRRSRAARRVGIAGCVLPFLVFTVASVAAGNFSHLTAEEQVLVVGGLALGWVGVLWALIALRDKPQAQLAQ